MVNSGDVRTREMVPKSFVQFSDLLCCPEGSADIRESGSVKSFSFSTAVVDVFVYPALFVLEDIGDFLVRQSFFDVVVNQECASAHGQVGGYGPFIIASGLDVPAECLLDFVF